MAAIIPPIPIPPLPGEDVWLIATKIFIGLGIIALLSWRLYKIKKRRK